MLQELIKLHHDLMDTMSNRHKRYLYEQIDWNDQAICILGARGVGKTTLLCQHYLEKYNHGEKALYISADNIHVLSQGLLTIASEYFNLGGDAIFIDEVHKYLNWSIEIKNIIDTYRTKKNRDFWQHFNGIEEKQSRFITSSYVL